MNTSSYLGLIIFFIGIAVVLFIEDPESGEILLHKWFQGK